MSKNWRDIIIGPETSVRDAWKALDRGAMQIALVVVEFFAAVSVAYVVPASGPQRVIVWRECR